MRRSLSKKLSMSTDEVCSQDPFQMVRILTKTNIQTNHKFKIKQYVKQLTCRLSPQLITYVVSTISITSLYDLKTEYNQ